MTNNPKQPVRILRNQDGSIEVAGFIPDVSVEERREKKRIGARRGHLKRRLMNNEPLTGEMLEFAISVAGEDSDIAKKLRTGQQLSDYELYLMVDVYLLPIWG